MATAEDGVMQMGSVNPAVDDAFQKNISGATNGAAELPIVAPNDPELESEDPVAAVPQERVVVKFLIPNVAAGSIIGKGGAKISDMQIQSGARMQLSRASEFYPDSSGSQDRILLISGTVDQLLTALHLVITKLKSEPASARSVQVKGDDTSERLQLRMLVHTRLCGTLIGKGGATIRSFNEDSNATFNISPPPTIPGLTERVVRIAGDVDELMRAVALLVTKLSENPDYHLLTDANLVYSARFLGAPPQGRFASPGGAQGDYQDRDGDGGRNSTGHVSVTIGIPESRVGNVIGKQGAIINQIKEVVNVTIRISKKGEHLPGTDQRACYISGPPDSVEIAHRLIQQKIEGR